MPDGKRYFFDKQPSMRGLQTEGKQAEWNLTPVKPLSLFDATNGNLPIRKDLSHCVALYPKLAKVPLYPFLLTPNGAADPEFLVVGPQLTAEQANALLYYAAPYKGFGLDTDDILGDWRSLYEDSYHDTRRRAHAAMPGWAQWEASRLLVLGLLERNYPDRYSGKFKQKDKDDVVIPVLRWKIGTERRMVTVDPLEENLRHLLGDMLPDYIKDPSRLDNGMGIAFLSAYSPEQTKWEARGGYTATASTKQSIGPTQVLPYAIRHMVEIRHGKRPDNPAVNPEHSPILAAFDRAISPAA